MNKELYNNCIKQYIRDLITEKDNLCEEISGIATTFETHGEEYKNLNLNEFEISAINSKRTNMGTIYKLIEDLDKLIIKEED